MRRCLRAFPARVAALTSLALVSVAGCACSSKPSPGDPSELAPGGATSVSWTLRPSLSLPASNLPDARKGAFYAGRALAHQPWVRAPSITDARDGLGPLYNARSCLGCHPHGGRGTLPKRPGQRLHSVVVRLGLERPGQQVAKLRGAALEQWRASGALPDPTYGHQLQNQSTSLSHIFGLESTPPNPPGRRAQRRRPLSRPRNVRHTMKAKPAARRRDRAAGARREVKPEAHLTIRWERLPFRYPDGREVALRRPILQIAKLAYGPLDPHTRRGLRVAPPLHGLGLLAAIPEAELKENADPEDANGDGVSGRLSRVWDLERKAMVIGRFGLKANRSSLRVQVAAALQGDMGITNPIFPEQPCTSKQKACAAGPHGVGASGFEISNKLLTLMVDYVRSIGVPRRSGARRERVLRGRQLFRRVGCASCHRPSYVTGDDRRWPHLSRQRVWPYTDLLLHDMGEGLADGRREYHASGREWRTAPLWSVVKSGSVNGNRSFLHDGRARSVEEAVLWHGGEGAGARDRFTRLSRAQRAQLLAFVRSL